MKVFVTGGTGYVGSSLVRLLSLAGHECRVLSRNPETARQHLASVQDVYPVQGDVTSCSIEQLAELMAQNQAVVHLVGIIVEKGTPGFEMMHTEATRRVVEAAKRAEVKRFVHMSALGTRKNAVARYHRTKWEAEQFVRESGMDWTIFRPSIIFGAHDDFLNAFAGIARRSPVLPVIGSGQGKLQPIWVEDVCRCFVQSLGMPETAGKTYDLGGECAYSLERLVQMVAGAMGRRRMLAHLPLPVARLLAQLFDLLPGKPPFTEDQIIMLGEDNICDPEPMKRTFGFTPRSLEDYLAERFGHEVRTPAA